MSKEGSPGAKPLWLQDPLRRDEVFSPDGDCPECDSTVYCGESVRVCEKYGDGCSWWEVLDDGE